MPENGAYHNLARCETLRVERDEWQTTATSLADTLERVRVIIGSDSLHAEVEAALSAFDASLDAAGGRHPQPSHPPLPQTLAIAERIRMHFGHGGANFPGARELYEAAAKIEAWAADHTQRTEPQETGEES